jgi:hypothetical protein
MCSGDSLLFASSIQANIAPHNWLSTTAPEPIGSKHTIDRVRFWAGEAASINTISVRYWHKIEHAYLCAS